ncbi:hypothetical protein CDD81_7556 [Ophiocordyceps australis]|uniref:DCG1-like protein n=1 Tax=Ophiocordyceps australis TaxID=1399860 RepID=A0A2C5XXY8_9HYPO|nr:hypothetical protein CDD81_7556 [Ophiocordyceps australis]
MKLLLINPNSVDAMTKAMEVAARATPVSDALQIDVYTAPSLAPQSINNGEHIADSSKHVLDDMVDNASVDVQKYDALLVACYSVHILVPQLASRFPHATVTGIFEASILTALSLIAGVDSSECWGIVTTGKFWEKHLTDGVGAFLGYEGRDKRFCGVYSTGLTASDLHSLTPEAIRAKVKSATLKLLAAGNVACVAMGCGAMAGLEDVIRDAAREAYGRERGDGLYIIDGVKAGVIQLHQMVNCKKVFR